MTWGIITIMNQFMKILMVGSVCLISGLFVGMNINNRMRETIVDNKLGQTVQNEAQDENLAIPECYMGNCPRFLPKPLYSLSSKPIVDVESPNAIDFNDTPATVLIIKSFGNHDAGHVLVLQEGKILYTSSDEASIDAKLIDSSTLEVSYQLLDRYENGKIVRPKDRVVERLSFIDGEIVKAKE